jgi:hypothetical protein
MALQIRRGTNTERQDLQFAEGELIYTTDSKRLFVGDGTTDGGIPVSAGMEALLDDTTPQLGGSLDLNGNDISGTGNISITGSIHATGNITSDGNISLGNDAGDNVTVAGSIGSHIIPITDSTFDLGSQSNRWKNGFFSGLTVDGQIDAVSFVGHILADDSTVVFDANTGNLRAESISGTFTGNVVGNLTGDVTGNVTGNLTGNVTGNLTGNVTGNVTGIVDGDLVGSVFSDDSQLLVDGINGSIPGPVITGQILNVDRIVTTTSTDPSDIAGSSANFARVYEDNTPSVVNISKARGVIGSETAVQAGDDIGLIRFVGFDGTNNYGCAAIVGSADPDGTVSSGVIPGKLEFQTYNNSGTPITRAEIDYNGTFKTYGIHWGLSTAPTGIPFYSLNNSNISSDGPRFLMRRSRGTFDTPLTVVDTDVLHRVTWGGYDGTSYVDTAYITASVDGTVSTGVIPTKLEVKTTNTAGSVQTNMTCEVDGTTSLGGAIKMATYADTSTRDTEIPTPSPGMVVFVTDGDGGGTPQFQGYNGSAWVSLN